MFWVFFLDLTRRNTPAAINAMTATPPTTPPTIGPTGTDEPPESAAVGPGEVVVGLDELVVLDVELDVVRELVVVALVSSAE
jgi:hypothetical protein